jgi:recombinational DNA repair protein RecT
MNLLSLTEANFQYIIVYNQRANPGKFGLAYNIKNQHFIFSFQGKVEIIKNTIEVDNLNKITIHNIDVILSKNHQSPLYILQFLMELHLKNDSSWEHLCSIVINNLHKQSMQINNLPIFKSKIEFKTYLTKSLDVEKVFHIFDNSLNHNIIS